MSSIRDLGLWVIVILICAAAFVLVIPTLALFIAVRILRWRRRRCDADMGPGHPDRYARLTWRQRYALARIRMLRHRSAPEPTYTNEESV